MTPVRPLSQGGCSPRAGPDSPLVARHVADEHSFVPGSTSLPGESGLRAAARSGITLIVPHAAGISQFSSFHLNQQLHVFSSVPAQRAHGAGAELAPGYCYRRRVGSRQGSILLLASPQYTGLCHLCYLQPVVLFLPSTVRFFTAAVQQNGIQTDTGASWRSCTSFHTPRRQQLVVQILQSRGHCSLPGSAASAPTCTADCSCYKRPELIGTRQHGDRRHLAPTPWHLGGISASTSAKIFMGKVDPTTLFHTN